MALADQAVVSGSRFAATMVIGRTCGPDQLGLYSLGFTFIVIASCALEALVTIPYTVYANRLQGSRAAKYAGSVLIHTTLLSLATGVTLCEVALLLTIFMPSLARCVWMLTALSPLFLLHEFARRMAFAHLRISTAFVLDCAMAILSTGGLAALYFTGLLSPLTAFVVFGVSSAACGATWLWLSRRSFVVVRKRVRLHLTRNWLFGRWTFAHHMTLVSHGYIIPWCLAVVLDTTATGRCIACETLVLLANPVLIGIGNIMTPMAAKAFADGGVPMLRATVHRSAFWLRLGASTLFIGLVLAGNIALCVLYGDSYGGHQAVISVLALAMVAEALCIACDGGLCALARPNIAFMANVIALGVTICTSAALVVPFGVLGATCGLPAGRTVAMVIQWTLFRAHADQRQRTQHVSRPQGALGVKP